MLSFLNFFKAISALKTAKHVHKYALLTKTAVRDGEKSGTVPSVTSANCGSADRNVIKRRTPSVLNSVPQQRQQVGQAITKKIKVKVS